MRKIVDWFKGLSQVMKIVVIGGVVVVVIIAVITGTANDKQQAKEDAKQAKIEQKKEAKKKAEKPVLTQNDMKEIGQQISDIQHSGNLIGNYITNVSDSNVEDMAKKITWEVAEIVTVRRDFNSIEGIEKAKQVSPEAVQLKTAINERAQFLIDYGTYTSALFYGDTSAKLDDKWKDTEKANTSTYQALSNAMDKFAGL
ncbi:hypothetical protein [Listeria monocytogenes]|uniref:hypothetical protein n=1 Tax=Listeria monocytogenes TaxID=1639 RepID=UPI001E29303E|nr:hypothetical protein [Listeria monocytogenes]MCD2223036.1 hypothetical protein [Listeria monocytogenes]